MSAHETMRDEQSVATGRLLLCGVVAGPLFLAVWLVQVLVNDGFDPSRHPLSLLSLGDLGWIQITNFLVTGGLLILAAVGMRSAMAGGPGYVWGPLFVGAFGAGLVVAGIFPTDAGAGFPAGAPLGTPDMSWHGLVHEIGFGVASVSWIAACVVFARRFSAVGPRRWVVLSITAPVAALVIMAWPDLDSLPVRLLFATAVEFGYLSALLLHLRWMARSRTALAGPNARPANPRGSSALLPSFPSPVEE